MTRADVIAYLESLDAHALGELIDELQRRLGLPTQTQPQPHQITMGAPLVVDAPGYTVVVVGITADRKFDVLRLFRELHSLPLADAKRLVESPPIVFAEFRDHSAAADLAARLRHAGAIVEIRDE